MCVGVGERGREQIERERKKEAQKVEKSQLTLSQSSTRIGQLTSQSAAGALALFCCSWAGERGG